MTLHGRYLLEVLNVTEHVTAKDLEYGLSVLAKIIDTQGDAVWPLFERLERELEDVRSRRERVKLHLSFKQTKSYY